MELREFAEQILFATSLDLKLAPPPSLTDHSPGPAIATPKQPERPPDLLFHKGKSSHAFPSVQHLEKDAVRGQLLHFFANHELLATELMALVLLKFPDAPKAFRKGLLQTLRDEQEHTRLYIERLKQLGVGFGAHAVNGYFWNVIAPMSTPMDYISRLSLTFEQANLDFSGHFAQQFKLVGDTDSETLLERIHRDEIAHVGYGLKWFRRWKDPDLSDWEAYESQLHYPLSPSRAKGIAFNTEARRRAGLGATFINELFVYSKSKGRTPNVYLFNPLAESIMAKGTGFKRRKHQETLAHDLAALPQFLCRKDDVVLVPTRPSVDFLAGLKEAGFELPQFEALQAGHLAADSELRDRKVGGLRPWAWSPESIEVLQPLLDHLTSPPMPVGKAWTDRIQPLFSKAWGVARLRDFLDHEAGHGTGPDADWLCPPMCVGILTTDLEEAVGTVHDIRHAGTPRVVAKSLYGQAGTGILRLWESNLRDSQITWIRRNIQDHGAVIIEPWLDRVLDFSCQLEMRKEGLRVMGFVGMENDPRGQYQASVYHPSFTRGLSQEITRFLHGASGNRMKILYDNLVAFLEPKLESAGFRGALGIDALVYRDELGQLRLKPLVEINPRHTMGRLLLELMRRASPGRSGKMELVNPSTLRRRGFKSFAEYADDLRERFPLQWKGEVPRRITSGAVCLNDPREAQCCLAVFYVT